ncbi:MAG: hypothetical protein K2X57_18410 [Xanthobacteraceae bacterium]|nr:hypothetical protein [Xanthobacteraceae bacterium]
MEGLDRLGHGRISEGWGGRHRKGSGKRKERAAIHFAQFGREVRVGGMVILSPLRCSLFQKKGLDVQSGTRRST